jgi:hypothetical protein
MVASSSDIVPIFSAYIVGDPLFVPFPNPDTVQLFLGTVGLVFAPLAPLVPVGAVLVIWINSWVRKYKLMFRYVSFVENAGVSSPFDQFFSNSFLSSAYGTQLSIVYLSPYY